MMTPVETFYNQCFDNLPTLDHDRMDTYHALRVYRESVRQNVTTALNSTTSSVDEEDSSMNKMGKNGDSISSSSKFFFIIMTSSSFDEF